MLRPGDKREMHVVDKVENLKRVFEAGHDIVAEVSLKGKKPRFRFRVVDVGENYLLIKVPSELTMNLQVPLGAIVRVSTIREGVVYSLDTRLVSEESQFLKLALEEQASALQRRNYVRVESFLPFRYRELSQGEFERRKKFLLGRANTADFAYSGFAWTRGARDDEIVNDPMGRLLLEINFKLDRLLFASGGHSMEGFSEGQAEELNISGSGLCFNAERGLPLGSSLELEFALPLMPPAHIRALGEVVRVEQKGDEGNGSNWSIGVNFVAINEWDREEIIRYTFIKQRQNLRNSL